MKDFEISSNEEMSMSDVFNMGDFLLPVVNDIIEGEVIRVTPQEVTVEINGATEGTIYLNELTLEKADSAKDIVKVGDKIRAIIKKVSDEQILLSRRALLQHDRYQELKAAFEKGEILQGKVIKAVKNALIVDIGLEAFMPGNMIDTSFVSDVSVYVGQEVPVKIVEFNPRNKRVTVSRKAVVAEELKAAREEQRSLLALGQEVEATVLRMEKFGAFVRFGALEGLVHISEISHLPVAKVEDALEIGQKVQAKVIKIDGSKLQLSIKAMSPTPFAQFAENHAEGDVLTGTVTQLSEYGAFVKVADGVEGLVHLSELSWGHRVKLEEVLSEGQTIQVKVISINQEKGRLGLSIKQLEQDPWQAFAHEVGDVVTGEVVSLTDLGAFIRVAPHVEGLCHFSEGSWNPGVRLDSLVSVGEKVELKIINFDPKKNRIGLSLRQVKENPWHAISIKEGQVIPGKVVSINNRGAHVQVAEDVVGFLPVNQISEKRIGRVEDALSVGQELDVKVTRFEPNQSRMELSVRRITEDAERAEFDTYMKQQKQEESETETLGDLFGDSLKDLLK